MQNAETANPEEKRSDREEDKSERAFSDEETMAGSVFNDIVTLFALIATSVRDTARLLDLETQLVVKTVVMIRVLSVVLGAMMVGIWLSIMLTAGIGLYEYTRLGMTLSIAIVSLVNVVCAGVLLHMVKRLVRRLLFPQTRLAVQTLINEASRTMQ